MEWNSLCSNERTSGSARERPKLFASIGYCTKILETIGRFVCAELRAELCMCVHLCRLRFWLRISDRSIANNKRVSKMDTLLTWRNKIDRYVLCWLT